MTRVSWVRSSSGGVRSRVGGVRWRGEWGEVEG